MFLVQIHVCESYVPCLVVWLELPSAELQYRQMTKQLWCIYGHQEQADSQCRDSRPYHVSHLQLLFC